jgi:hypothetical protein
MPALLALAVSAHYARQVACEERIASGATARGDRAMTNIVSCVEQSVETVTDRS